MGNASEEVTDVTKNQQRISDRVCVLAMLMCVFDPMLCSLTYDTCYEFRFRHNGKNRNCTPIYRQLAAKGKLY